MIWRWLLHPGYDHCNVPCISLNVPRKHHRGSLLPLPVSKRVGTSRCLCLGSAWHKDSRQTQGGSQACPAGQLDVVVEHVRTLDDNFCRPLPHHVTTEAELQRKLRRNFCVACSSGASSGDSTPGTRCPNLWLKYSLWIRLLETAAIMRSAVIVGQI